MFALEVEFIVQKVQFLDLLPSRPGAKRPRARFRATQGLPDTIQCPRRGAARVLVAAAI